MKLQDCGWRLERCVGELTSALQLGLLNMSEVIKGSDPSDRYQPSRGDDEVVYRRMGRRG